jgi:hypothetical protein
MFWNMAEEDGGCSLEMGGVFVKTSTLALVKVLRKSRGLIECKNLHFA